MRKDERMRRVDEEPTWQPLSRLPLIASMIDAGLGGAREQHELLLRARRRPYVLDDHTVARVVQAFTHTRGDVELYEEQLARWRRAALSPVQHREIDRLADELYRLRQVVDAILAIAEELKRATIERTVEESDLERGLDLYVLGGPPDRSPLDPGV